ncbi:hypothetical protein GNZ21_15095 [Nesterenkonia alkaliphila]|uniref:Nuclear transport factor 2 family protein n=1 Tax=Nesterenkonia alkaliphila TaxID=1463631 RepID=A0A7K1UMY9_9MICC|nr:hypothetical protein [Nesterenkonia alkaliphila]GFZ88041.1 hypothetical protein GCM10011359_16790 [Nesterenkonia alkaliphila]
MEIKLPADCGNSPRIGIVSDFAVNWAKGDAQSVSEWLTEDSVWTLVGGGSYSGPAAAEQVRPTFTPEHVEVVSVITHGRLASCDGYMETAGVRIDFSHVLRFASTAKTARIAELRSYCIHPPRSH